MKKNNNKNIILFVNKLHNHMAEAIHRYEKENKIHFRLAIICDEKKLHDPKTQKKLKLANIVLPCDLNSPHSIQKALLPFQKELLAISCRGENQIPFFIKVIPYVPYLKTPTTESLKWAIDKILMRRRLAGQNKKITPAYTLVSNTKKKSLKKIEEKIGFPAIIKPTGCAASRLVAVVYHQEELKKELKKVFRKVKSVYKETGYTNEPQVLVEQFMEGEMYSTDAYITGRGKVYFCPFVHVKTGRTIGFDDFFGYQQIIPTQLKKESIENAELVAIEAVHALGLRSTTAHIELLKTEKGWKVIELGPRIGGFRHMIYHLSYGINHTMNDVLIRIPQKPLIPKKVLGHSVAMKFFAKKEGRITNLYGIKKAKELSSFKKIYRHKKIGDYCAYAKNGGSSVFDIILFNRDRSKLLADIRRLEQMIKIETSSHGA